MQHEREEKAISETTTSTIYRLTDRRGNVLREG
jgi:hypothetical protein